MSPIIAIGSDHAGFQLKEKIKEYLTFAQTKYIIQDCGTYNENSCDYPDYAHQVAYLVNNGQARYGILVCGTGNGINMTANKYSQVRSALCWQPDIATMARQHNDANILVLPGRYINDDDAIKTLNNFLLSEFEGGRHLQRMNKISKIVTSLKLNDQFKIDDYTISK